MDKLNQNEREYINAMKELRFSSHAKSRILNHVLTSQVQEKGIISAESDKKEEKTLKEKDKIYRFSKMGLIAAVMTIALMVSALATTGVLKNTFGLWLGKQKVELDALTPVTVDMDALKNYISRNPRNDDVGADDMIALFSDSGTFADETGIILTTSDQIVLKDILLHVSTSYDTAHMSMEVTANGTTRTMNGMFILNGNQEDNFGYGVEEKQASYIYRYGNGKCAYFVQDKDRENPMTQVFFCENGIMYQLFVDSTQEGETFAKTVVNGIAGIDKQ